MSKGIFTATNVPDGVYILTDSKKFIQPKFWGNFEEKENPSCVAIVHSGQAMLIALTDLTEEEEHLLPVDAVQRGQEHETLDSALQDFDGLENTKRLSASGSAIATEVLKHTILGHPFHIPTLGEWQRLYNEKPLLNGALAILEESPLKDNWYLTSTRKSGKRNYFFYWGDGYRYGDYQFNNGFVRCVSAVSLAIL